MDGTGEGGFLQPCQIIIVHTANRRPYAHTPTSPTLERPVPNDVSGHAESPRSTSGHGQASPTSPGEGSIDALSSNMGSLIRGSITHTGTQFTRSPVGPTGTLPTIFSLSRVTGVSVCHSGPSLSSTGLVSHPAATPPPSPVPSPDRRGSSSPAVRYARLLTSLLLSLILRGLPRPHRTAANRAARFGV
jgi:hypothetical protein